MLFTAASVALFTYHDGTREFAQKNLWVFIVALVLMLVTIIMLSCCEGVRRATPHNFIVLSLFTIAEGYLVGMSTMRFQPEIVSCKPFLDSSMFPIK